jgi:hypothetical protein
MSGLELTPEEYITEIIMSDKSFLLLEGSDDEDFFIIVYNFLRNNKTQISPEKLELLKNIIIDTAESIKGELGNRAKIEKICELVAQETSNINRRVLGFVDREFREFEYSNDLQDHLKTHKINKRLIWSRGHSIENYFFEISTLREAFNNYLISSFYQEAFEIFESKFDQTLRITCALSLAGFSENLLDPIAKSLNWQCIEITSTSLKINLEKWEQILTKQFKLDQLRIHNLFNQFETYLKMTYKSDLETSRWLSHGHIGFNFMFGVYGKCLSIIAASDSDQRKNHSKEAEKVNENKKTRFRTVANAWIRSQSFEKQNNNTHDFPIKCFWMLINNF